MLSPHFVQLVRTPIVMPRPASSFLNIATSSVRCAMAVQTGSRQVGINYDKLGRRSPTMQRIHRTYGGAPAISCASASHAPKRYTTSSALWRANVRLTFARPSPILRLSFARPSLDLRSRRQPPFDTIWACFPVSSDGIIKQKHNTKTFPYMRSVVMSGDRTSYSRRGRLRTRTGETAPPFSKHPFDIRLQRHDGLDTRECNISVSAVVELAISKQTLMLETCRYF